MQLIIQSSPKELQLKEELKTLICELRSIHMVNEFPKYARTERKMNKIKSELNTLTQTRRGAQLKVTLGLNVAFHSLEAVIFIFLIFTFRHDPVVIFPAEWLSPLGSLISFPTSVHGAVSVPLWIMVCRSALRQLANVASLHWVIYCHFFEGLRSSFTLSSMLTAKCIVEFHYFCFTMYDPSNFAKELVLRSMLFGTSHGMSRNFRGISRCVI